MNQYEATARPRFQSKIELLNLHNELNNELAKFNRALKDISNYSHMDALQLILNRIQIMEKIREINKQIQEIATVRRKRKEKL